MSGGFSQYAPDWLRTRWAKILGGVLATLLLLALVAPYLLDVDRYRGRISDIISLQTGRKVTLGRLRAAVLPRIGFSVDGFQMANPPGFAQGQLVRADQIRGALAFWPLIMRRELRVVSLELVEPQLMLLEDDRGRNNYSFPPDSSAASPGPVAASAPSSASGQTGSGSASVTLMVDQVTMSNASVYYGTIDRRGHPAATVHVSGLNVELRQLALHPLRIRDWQADASLGGTELILSGWNTPLLFDSGALMLRNGKIDSSFTVTLGNAARVEGTITVRDIEDAVPQFILKTATLDLNALLAGTAEPLPARGRNFNSAPLPAAGTPRTLARPRPAPAASVVPASASLAGPTRLVAQGHIEAQRVRQGVYTAGPLTADLRIYNDRTEIWPFTLRLAGGAVQVTARTDRRQVPQRFSANIQVRDLSAERMLENSPPLKGRFAGTAELDAQVVGSLETRWTESLTGRGQFVIRNGRIAGFNLTGAARSIADLAGVTGDTPFTRITGDLSIRNERVASRQIHMDSPRGTLDLKGSAGFYGALNYEGQMITQVGAPPSSAGGSASDILGGVLGSAIARNMGPTQINVPFLLRGTLQQPQLLPGRAALKFSRPAQASQSPQPGQPQETNDYSFPNLFGRQ